MKAVRLLRQRRGGCVERFARKPGEPMPGTPDWIGRVPGRGEVIAPATDGCRYDVVYAEYLVEPFFGILLEFELCGEVVRHPGAESSSRVLAAPGHHVRVFLATFGQLRIGTGF